MKNLLLQITLVLFSWFLLEFSGSGDENSSLLDWPQHVGCLID
jgi:hypothetical protein